MLIAADLFDYDADRREYVQDISMISIEPGQALPWGAPHEFTLTDCPEPGMHRSFVRKRTDWSGGDVAGWRYQELPGPNRGPRPLEVLIIND